MDTTDKPRADKRPWPPHSKAVAQIWAEEEAKRLSLDDWGRELQFRTTRKVAA